MPRQDAQGRWISDDGTSYCNSYTNSDPNLTLPIPPVFALSAARIRVARATS